ncbi:hypothetical protein AAGW05_16260 [Arthrobacter sp. LAPM80]|uniref:hypothetical protein n=1 Tax=Arthrobacter sp. LAPM80 TaxID=3141788 RepID=UPI00398AF49B
MNWLSSISFYVPVLQGLSTDREQIERQVFSGNAAAAERIYRLSQEVIDVQHTVSSMTAVLRVGRPSSSPRR